MTQEEELQALREELQAVREENVLLKALVAELLPLREQVEGLKAHVKQLEKRLSKDSRTSSKPPSSDGLKQRPRSTRQASTKTTGGQPGHPGHTLAQVPIPDEIMSHRPHACEQCQTDLHQVIGVIVEHRQVLDLPAIRLLAREHQVKAVCCPNCHHLTLGGFPKEVSAPAQYGPHVQALAVYLHQGQLLPVARTCDVLAEMCGASISQGTLLRWVQQAASRLEPTERIAELVTQSRLLHGNETGIHVYGLLHWLHVSCTRWLTHLSWHASRGREAMQRIGIWPRFAGRGMHDRWASYDAYPCAYSICRAHLLRDCAALAEQDQELWAADMHTFLLDLHAATQEWSTRRVPAMAPIERDEWVARYFEILAAGYAAQPPPLEDAGQKRKGRRKQSAAKNLLDALLPRVTQRDKLISKR
ncbi:IS66 family transposase [Ktedonobacter racemifer]|nr:transposase [Ktedonobacter racemifer]